MLRQALRVIQSRAPRLAAAFDRDEPPPRWADKRLRDIVIAFGLGYYRVFDPWEPGWSRGHWPKAAAVVQAFMHIWVLKTARWVASLIRLPSLFEAQGQEELKSITGFLFSCVVSEGHCLLGQECLARHSPAMNAHNRALHVERVLSQHTLLGWRPDEMSLDSFLVRAIKGELAVRRGKTRPLRNKMTFAVGSIVKGLFFKVVNAEFGLLVGDALFWRCPRHQEWVFYGLACEHCEHEAPGSGEPSPDTRYLIRRWLLLPSHKGGSFFPTLAYQCKRCGGWVLLGRRARCPRDGCEPIRKPLGRVVWLLRQGQNVELDGQFGAEFSLEAAGVASAENDARLQRMAENIELLPPEQQRCLELCLKHNVALSAHEAGHSIENLLAAAHEMGLTHVKFRRLLQASIAQLRSHMLSIP